MSCTTKGPGDRGPSEVHAVWIDEVAGMTQAQLDFLLSEVRIQMVKKKNTPTKAKLARLDARLEKAIECQGRSHLCLEVKARATEKVTAARWYAQSRTTWPSWWGAVVKSSGIDGSGYLLLPGGHIMALKIGDWLVRRASGRVDAMSHATFTKTFEEDH